MVVVLVIWVVAGVLVNFSIVGWLWWLVVKGNIWQLIDFIFGGC